MAAAPAHSCAECLPSLSHLLTQRRANTGVVNSTPLPAPLDSPSCTCPPPGSQPWTLVRGPPARRAPCGPRGSGLGQGARGGACPLVGPPRSPLPPRHALHGRMSVDGAGRGQRSLNAWTGGWREQSSAISALNRKGRSPRGADARHTQLAHTQLAHTRTLVTRADRGTGHKRVCVSGSCAVVSSEHLSCARAHARTGHTQTHTHTRALCRARAVLWVQQLTQHIRQQQRAQSDSTARRP